MGWDRGRYYTRSRKVNGRVVREYIGTGTQGELASQMDAITRADRQAEKAALRAEREALDALDADLKTLIENADLVARAALLAAGYHQHKRGEWRKRREQDCPTDRSRPPDKC
jgi:hypothetical protein